jgi:hypothetical protein
MLDLSWQRDTSRDVFNVWQDVKSKLPVPDFLTEKGPYWYTDFGIGQAFFLYELDRSKLADAYDYLTTVSRMYRNIPGIKYKIKVCLERDDVERTRPPN